MVIGAGLSLAAVALQSTGKVVYGSFLQAITAPWFVLISICLCALVFLVVSRGRRPPAAPGLLLKANLWTAITFVGLFFALRHLPPAVFAAIDISMSLLATLVLTSLRQRAWPSWPRRVVCAGILAGCALLASDEIGDALGSASWPLVAAALAASAAVGVSSALTVVTCQSLAGKGWASVSVLAHRFYLTVGVVLAWLLLPGQDPGLPFGPEADAATVGLVLLTAGLVVLFPALLVQMALRRTDAFTVLICMAVQPTLTFLMSLASPAYDWNAITFAGVAVVTLFVGLDLLLKQASGPVAPAVAPAVGTRRADGAGR